MKQEFAKLAAALETFDATRSAMDALEAMMDNTTNEDIINALEAECDALYIKHHAALVEAAQALIALPIGHIDAITAREMVMKHRKKIASLIARIAE